MEDDPEFLELSARQRRAIDRAFERGLRAAKGRPSKRRRLIRSTTTGNTTPATPASGGFIPEDEGGGFLPEDGGGFMDDGGGFVPDDDAGGFIPEDGAGGFVPGGGFMDDVGGGFIPDSDDAGGFIPDEQAPLAGPSTSAGPSRTSHAGADEDEEDPRIPLRLVPSLLNRLGLPSDEDVMSVFRSLDDDSAPADGVKRKDFRAVCAALMPPSEGADDASPPSPTGSEDEADGDGDVDMDDLSSGSGSDEFEPEDDDDDEYGAPTTATTTRSGKGKGRSKAKRREVLEEKARPKLNPRQRESARAIWDLLKPSGKEARGESSGILSREEVKKWARELGEMWSDGEITDMVTLFSGQHEGRGLTFEDFGVVLVRAGMV